MMHGNRKDLTGQRFGRLVVIEPVTTGEYRNSVWLCQCDCGNKKIVPTYRLLNGRTFSCGCYRKQAKQVIEELAKVKTENEKLKVENERLKAPSMIIPQVGKLGVPIEQYCKLKQALEDVREIINFRFKTPYMKLGLKETDKIIEDIEKIINEVLKSENH